jgi:hypothetical protein
MSFHPVMPYGTEQWHRSQRATLPEGPEFQYTAENRARFEEFAAHYAPEHRKSAVLHALYLAQEQQGYISANAARHVAEVIGCTTAEVEDVVSYYVMFHRNRSARTSCRCARRCRARWPAPSAWSRSSSTSSASSPARPIRPACSPSEDGVPRRVRPAPVMMVNNDHWHECLSPGRRRLVDAHEGRRA